MSPSTQRHVLRSCVKHNHHDSFIPIKHLSLEHWPDHDLHSGSALRLVQGLSRLVVRVRVVVRGERGVGRMKTCTGVVTSLGEEEEEVTVTVPLHSVQNDVEVAQTTAEFFYDTENADDIVTVNGISLIRHDSQHVAQLTCRAGPELRQRFQQWREETTKMSAVSCRGLEDLNRGWSFQGSTVVSSRGWGNWDLVRSPQGSTVVLISHPHGFSKRVSLGVVCGRDVVKGSGDDGGGGGGGGGVVDCNMGDEGEGLWMSSRQCGMSSAKTWSEEVSVVSSQPSLSSSCLSSRSSSSEPLSWSSSQPSSSCLQSQPSFSSSSSSSQFFSEQLLTLEGKLEEKLTASQSSVTCSDSPSLWKRNSMRVSVHNKITEEGETSTSGTATPVWNKILSLRSASISGTATPAWNKILSFRSACVSGTATPVWNKVLSLCSAVCRVLGSFSLGNFNAWERISLRSEIVPIYHSAASCPGSSGGVVIVIGGPAWAGLDETVTSLPVYLHVGVWENRGVAVPLVVSREVLSLCFGRVGL